MELTVGKTLEGTDGLYLRRFERDGETWISANTGAGSLGDV